LREIIVAHAFGTGAEYDAFLAAIVIPSAIYTVVDYGLPNILVPVYSRHGAAAHRPPSGFWIWLFLLAGMLTFVVAFMAGTVVSLVVPGLPEVLSRKAADMLRMYAVIIFLGVICAAGRARLQGRKFFTRPAFGPPLLNITIMGSIFFLADKMGAYSIVWGTLTGTLVLGIWYWWPVREQPPAPVPSKSESIHVAGWHGFLPSCPALSSASLS